MSTATGDVASRERLLKQAQSLQNIMVSYATGTSESEEEYQELRRELVNAPTVKDLLPSFAKSCRSLSHFWGFIKPKYDTYAQRRRFIHDEFRPLLDHLEGIGGTPADTPVSDVLADFNEDGVHHVWARALDRRTVDPEGAITLARTLVETVCKHILDEAGVPYEEGTKLPKLYGRTAEQLQLSPGQYSEEVFSQILGGCTAVVEGLGSVRNRLSDSHGKGKRRPVKPASRHAQLAVNLAGATAVFLIQTWNVRNEI